MVFNILKFSECLPNILTKSHPLIVVNLFIYTISMHTVAMSEQLFFMHECMERKKEMLAKTFMDY